jgi:hypothetical protein
MRLAYDYRHDQRGHECTYTHTLCQAHATYIILGTHDNIIYVYTSCPTACNQSTTKGRAKERKRERERKRWQAYGLTGRISQVSVVMSGSLRRAAVLRQVCDYKHTRKQTHVHAKGTPMICMYTAHHVHVQYNVCEGQCKKEQEATIW